MTQKIHHDEPNVVDSLFHQLATICDHAVLIFSGAAVVFANDSAVGMLGAVRIDQVMRQPAIRFGLSLVDNAATTGVAPTFTNCKKNHAPRWQPGDSKRRAAPVHVRWSPG